MLLETRERQNGINAGCEKRELSFSVPESEYHPVPGILYLEGKDVQQNKHCSSCAATTCVQAYCSSSCSFLFILLGRERGSGNFPGLTVAMTVVMWTQPQRHTAISKFLLSALQQGGAKNFGEENWWDDWWDDDLASCTSGTSQFFAHYNPDSHEVLHFLQKREMAYCSSFSI